MSRVVIVGGGVVGVACAYHARLAATGGPGEDVTFHTAGGPPKLRFAAERHDVHEGDGAATLTVERSGDATATSSVEYHAFSVHD